MEEDEPSFLEPIDYSEDSNNEEAEPEIDPSNDGHENPDPHDSLSDPETGRDWRWALQAAAEAIRDWISLLYNDT